MSISGIGCSPSAFNPVQQPSARQSLAQIGSALQNGNISNAQQILSALQSPMTGAHGHHRHHSGAGSANGIQPAANSTTTSTTSSLVAAMPGISTSATAATNVLV